MKKLKFFITIFIILIISGILINYWTENTIRNKQDRNDVMIGIELKKVENINSSVDLNNVYFIISIENNSIKCIQHEYRWGLLEMYPIEKGISYNFNITGYIFNNTLKNYSFINDNNYLNGSIFFDGKYKTVHFNQTSMKYIEIIDLTYYCSEINIKGKDGIITIIISLPNKYGV